MGGVTMVHIGDRLFRAFGNVDATYYHSCQLHSVFDCNVQDLLCNIYTNASE